MEVRRRVHGEIHRGQRPPSLQSSERLRMVQEAQEGKQARVQGGVMPKRWLQANEPNSIQAVEGIGNDMAAGGRYITGIGGTQLWVMSQGCKGIGRKQPMHVKAVACTERFGTLTQGVHELLRRPGERMVTYQTDVHVV